MFLLDQNLPHQLRELWAEYGLHAETAKFRGWSELRNGDFTGAAYAAGFRVILTRDALFAKSAARVLFELPDLSVVIIQLPQRAWKAYRATAGQAWPKHCSPPPALSGAASG